MKNKLIASIASLVLGTAFLFVSFPLAERAHAAPAGGYSGSILENVYGVPAVIFNVVGTCAICAGVVLGVMALCHPEKPQA